jgi:hypothetical protein
LRESWGWPDDIAVLHVGRLAAEKNLRCCARAHALQKTYPQRLP